MAAILLAAGSSRRLPAEVPKPYLRLAGRTLLGHCLRAFQAAPSIADIVVVASAEWVGRAAKIARPYDKVVATVVGGRRRQDSVANALKVIPAECTVIAVHDVARPLVSVALIELVAAAGARHGAAIAASPMVDTIKEVERDRVLTTIDRSRVVRAGTPQAFRRRWLEMGMKRASQAGLEVTDDAALIEAIGRSVRVVCSDVPNLKVTTPSDLALAEFFLRRSGR